MKTSGVKKHPDVIAAEAVAEQKAIELKAAKDTVAVLEREHGAAITAVRAARIAADAAFPQCRLVQAPWRGGNETDAGLVVILRKTPGGMLVVRRVGDDVDQEIKFKWMEYSTKFVEARKRSSYTSNQLELRDVPAEYRPAAAAA